MFGERTLDQLLSGRLSRRSFLVGTATVTFAQDQKSDTKTEKKKKGKKKKAEKKDTQR